MAPDKPKKPPQAPPLFTATPISIIDDAKRLIEQSRKVQNRITRGVQPETATFANTLLLLAQDENTRTLEAHVLEFYQNVSTDEELRAASSVGQSLLKDFAVETAMREDLYNLIEAALKKNETLDPESRRLLEKEHKNYIRNGLGLPGGPRRNRFKEIEKRLGQISIDFQKNLNEENGGIWFTPKELDGVPEDALSELESGRGENEGKLRLTFKYPDVVSTLNYATSSETRRQLYIANTNKCNQNVPLLKEALVLRDEAARLLGYSNHAAFRLEDKMVKSPQAVDTFLRDLRSRLSARGLKEIETLKELKKADLESRGEQFDNHYYLWDHGYYDRLMLEKAFSFDQQKVAEYFPLNTSIQRMLKTLEKLFGLVFTEIIGKDRDDIAETGKGSDIVWHQDVQLFSVWDDEDDEFLGYLYLDLYPRNGKFGHAANFNLHPVRIISKLMKAKINWFRALLMQMENEDTLQQRWCATFPSPHKRNPVC
jgi:metallopeptidase MepB